MKTLILGVGNVLLSDEGLGVRVVEELRNRYKFPEEVCLMEGGTLGLSLLYHIEKVDRLLIIDVLLGGKPPGTLYKLRGEDVLTYLEKRRLSAHDIGIQEVLAMLRFVGRLPKEIVVLGMEPESFDASLELSPLVQKNLNRLIEEILKQLREWNIKAEVKGEMKKNPL
ncbi:MAG: HyaD/HybD family hydrogenase maturation endopeptidase [Aquificaceae bacterium]